MNTTTLKSSETDRGQVYNERSTRGFFEKLFYLALAKVDRGTLLVRFPEIRESVSLGKGEIVAEIYVTDTAFFKRTVLFGEIGFGEAYVLGYWQSNDLYGVLSWFLSNRQKLPTFASSKGSFFLNLLGFLNRSWHRMRPNTKEISRKNISEHYDLSNDFFSLMLDSTMAYSSAVFPEETSSLLEAQLNKFDLLAEKLQLQPHHHLLEIGCGWGGFSIYAAERFGCRVTAVTISKEQYEMALQKVHEKDLSDLVKVKLQDYREIEGKFDRIVSIEMVEALGFENFDVFFSKVDQVLKRNGIMALQCITFPDPYFKRYLKNVDFTQRHIFPGSVLMSNIEILKSLDRTGDLMVWDLQSIGLDYARTLYEWRSNVETNLDEIKKLGFDGEFLRKWFYYLDYCRTGFQERYINAIQVVLSRPMNPDLDTTIIGR